MKIEEIEEGVMMALVVSAPFVALVIIGAIIQGHFALAAGILAAVTLLGFAVQGVMAFVLTFMERRR